MVATPTCRWGPTWPTCHKTVFRAQSEEYALDCAHYAIKLNRADLLVRKLGCNNNFRSLNMLNRGIKFQCKVNAKSEILLQHVAQWQWSLFTCLSIVMTHDYGPHHKSGRKMTPYGFDSDICAHMLQRANVITASESSEFFTQCEYTFR